MRIQITCPVLVTHAPNQPAISKDGVVSHRYYETLKRVAKSSVHASDDEVCPAPVLGLTALQAWAFVAYCEEQGLGFTLTARYDGLYDVARGPRRTKVDDQRS